MQQRVFDVAITGINGLLMHADDLAWRDGMESWLADPENKRMSRPGDDRFPAWRWLGNVYHDGQFVGVPADNLMTAIREGGARVPVPGKKALTFKKQSQSGIVVNELIWPIETASGRVPWADVAALREVEGFSDHEELVRTLGFALFVKGAKIGTSKHIRVRPRFDQWRIAGSLTVFDETITVEVLRLILDAAGRYSGMGDWRPSSPKSPGPWGTFSATVTPRGTR